MSYRFKQPYNQAQSRKPDYKTNNINIFLNNRTIKEKVEYRLQTNNSKINMSYIFKWQ
jgi:hypothetical protein